MKKIFTAILLILVAGSTLAFGQTKPLPAPKEDAKETIGGLLISPLLQRQVVKPGQKASIDFKMENPGTIRDSSQLDLLSFTMEDWSYQTVYGAPGAHDCATWFTDKQQLITMEPGAKRETHLQFNVPSDASGPYWCMLKVSPRPQGSVTKSLVIYEIPILLIVGKNPRPALTVSSPIMKRYNVGNRTTMLMAVLPVENSSDGFTIIGATGTLRNGDSGRVLKDFILDDRNMMPGTKRHLSFMLPILPDGRYKLEFRAIMGSRALQTVTSDYVIANGVPTPASQAVTLQRSPLSIEPSALNLAIPREGSRTMTIRLTNNSDKPLKVELTAKPLDQSKSGAIGLTDGALPAGLTLENDFDSSPLDPKEERTVAITLHVDATAQGDLWFGLSTKSDGTNVQSESIFCTVSVPTTQAPMLAIENATVLKDGAKNIAVRFDVHNTGNVALRPEPSGSVLEDGVRLLDRLSVPVVGDGGLLPGKMVSCTAMLPQRMKPGKHIVELSYQYGEKNFATIRVPITVVAATAGAKAVKK